MVDSTVPRRGTGGGSSRPGQPGTRRFVSVADGVRPSRASRGGPGRLWPPRDARDVRIDHARMWSIHSARGRASRKARGRRRKGHGRRGSEAPARVQWAVPPCVVPFGSYGPIRHHGADRPGERRPIRTGPSRLRPHAQESSSWTSSRREATARACSGPRRQPAARASANPAPLRCASHRPTPRTFAPPWNRAATTEPARRCRRAATRPPARRSPPRSLRSRRAATRAPARSPSRAARRTGGCGCAGQ
jgi:hypothetical protein